MEKRQGEKKNVKENARHFLSSKVVPDLVRATLRDL